MGAEVVERNAAIDGVERNQLAAVAHATKERGRIEADLATLTETSRALVETLAETSRTFEILRGNHEALASSAGLTSRNFENLRDMHEALTEKHRELSEAVKCNLETLRSDHEDLVLSTRDVTAETLETLRSTLTTLRSDHGDLVSSGEETVMRLEAEETTRAAAIEKLEAHQEANPDT